MYSYCHCVQAHSSDCPNALKKCENCQQEIPAIKVFAYSFSITKAH